ncbi:ParA family protein [Thermostichus vulcanus]|uniref:ParA family protein n=1 Tax=Thermostichus vulcanus str. 'Rupite' TaxID=2813851 RepID=A0ABT0CA51_THEVL|nr:ParA family protein [Thermostichus vulcanus]MCJ2542660.1 ParA family protein [Thermostichus vulcanus str. 'Rupite']
MAKILAFTNNKGGTGKSTLCVHAAQLIAQRGERVLLIDLTSQATASSLYLEETGSLPEQETVWACLHPHHQRPLPEVIYTSDKGVDVIPAHSNMAEVAAHLAAAGSSAQHLLQQQLRSLQADYDFVFLDTPGELNALTANALQVAQRVVIPTRLNRADFSCTEVTLRYINALKGQLTQARTVLTMLDDRYLPGGIWSGSHTGQLYVQAQQIFADVLSPVTIPDSSDLRTAFDYGLTVMEYRPGAAVCQRLLQFVEHEVLL